jgi:predicted small metal-binding protein
MGWAIGCECGYVARGDDEERLVADAQLHAREAHHLELTREQILRSAREPLPRPATGERAEERGPP